MFEMVDNDRCRNNNTELRVIRWQQRRAAEQRPTKVHRFIDRTSFVKLMPATLSFLYFFSCKQLVLLL